MYELSLESSFSHFEQLENIKKQVAEFVSGCGGVIVSGIHCGRGVVTLAVPSENKDVIKCIVLEKVAETLVSIYKHKFFDKHINSSFLSDEIRSTLIVALSEFDKNTDVEIAKKNIVFSNYLILDSLYYFKMNELIARWRDVVLLVNANLPNLVAGDSVVDMMKFLIGTLPSKTNEVYLTMLDDSKYQLFIHDKRAKDKRIFNTKKDDFEQSLISELISLSPEKIFIEKTALSSLKFREKLEGLFDNKIFII